MTYERVVLYSVGSELLDTMINVSALNYWIELCPNRSEREIAKHRGADNDVKTIAGKREQNSTINVSAANQP